MKTLRSEDKAERSAPGATEEALPPPPPAPGSLNQRFAGRSVLQVREVAQDLRVSVMHVLRLIDEGSLSAMNVSLSKRSRWRIPVDAYEAFLKDRSSQPGAP